MFAHGSVVGGKFRIERELGRGGMGTVYAASHLTLGTPVALKFLNASYVDNAQVVERFVREAQSAARLNSEHVCRVLDADREGQVPYIVMELLSGTDLAKLVRSRGRLDHLVAADYIAQACAGLAEAHDAKLVHRDLKPGNLFLARRGDGSSIIKILDFGVAKSTRAQDFSLTQTTNIIGSPGYMSPEQLRSSKVVDPRSDIWALGVILFELAMGRPPFRAESVTELAIKITLDPTPAMSGVPDEYVTLVERCLEKEPGKRFQDAGSLAVALVALLPQPSSNSAVSRMLERSVDGSRESLEVTAVRTLYDAVADTAQSGEVVAPPHPVTTLAHASGVMSAAQLPQARSRRRMLGVVGSGIVLGVVAAVAVVRHGGGDAPTPAAAAGHVDPAPTPTGARSTTATPDAASPAPVIEPSPSSASVATGSAQPGSDATGSAATSIARGSADVEPEKVPAVPPPVKPVPVPHPPRHVKTPKDVGDTRI